jgi:hypothetical protein
MLCRAAWEICSAGGSGRYALPAAWAICSTEAVREMCSAEDVWEI